MKNKLKVTTLASLITITSFLGFGIYNYYNKSDREIEKGYYDDIEHLGGRANYIHEDGELAPNGGIYYHNRVIIYEKFLQGTWKMQSNEYRARVLRESGVR